MNFQERIEYLIQKGWVYNPESSLNKRWFCPATGQRVGFEQAVTTQRSVDAGRLVLTICPDCSVKRYAVPGGKATCTSCRDKARRAAKGGIIEGRPGDLVHFSFRVPKDIHEGVCHYAEKQGIFVQAAIAELLQSGLEATNG